MHRINNIFLPKHTASALESVSIAPSTSLPTLVVENILIGDSIDLLILYLCNIDVDLITRVDKKANERVKCICRRRWAKVQWQKFIPS